MSDRLLRPTLWAAALFNLAAAALLARPDSSVGLLVGLPAPVPLFYSLMCAMFVALFGVVYVWLAMRGVDRPLLWLGALGKLCAFALAALLWAAGNVPAPIPVVASGDLLLALWWISWLRGSR